MVWVSDTTLTRAHRFLRPVSMILAMTLTMGAAPAHADNTFLLQLGSFDSERTAKEKWQDIKSINADVLGNLTLHIAEVTLPPGRTTSYRTQAGPVTTREQATSLCNTLQGRGVQCYVVETAMLASEIAPRKPIAEASAPAARPSNTKHTVDAAPDDSAHADDPDYIPPPIDSGPIVVSSSEPSAPAVVSAAEVAEMPKPIRPSEKETIAVAPPASPVVPPSVETPAAVSAVNDRVVAGREPRFLNSGTSMHANAVPPTPVSAPTSEASVPPESPGFFSRLFGSNPPPAAATGVVGSVNVAEAVRVPLSNDSEPPRQKIVPVLPAVHGLGGYPSDSTAKTYWAQISYFRDETQALDFYRQFSASYPQFSDGVRVRITRPFTASSTMGRVSLRVGPFIGTDDVRTICAAANHSHARCTLVRDLGASFAMGGAPARTAAVTQATFTESGGSYWAQLGSFSSTQDAWDVWKELKSRNKKALRHARPSVVAPPTSSAMGPVFRLRVGPYTKLTQVSDVCGRLQSAGANCMVINER